MKKIIMKLYRNSMIRYLFFGGCTTIVNMVSFYLLRKIQVGLNIANIISIILAVIFAYVVNAKFVFEQEYQTKREHVNSFIKFIGARAVTMLIELVGVWMFVEVLGMRDIIGKFIVQFVVIMLNYLFSKFFVFKSEEG